MNYLTYIFSGMVFLSPIVSQANEIKMTGFVTAEFRNFVSNHQFDGQFNGTQSSLIVQPEFRSEMINGTEQYNFVPFIRLDSHDDARTHGDIRELYWQHNDDQWTLLVGVNRVFWGVVESNHLADIINQTDLVEDVDGKEKLGQPMINLVSQKDWGDLSFYVMPWFRERTFPSKEGRLRSESVIANKVAYESSSGEQHVDLSLRYSHYIGDWDFGMYYFKGTSREPRFLLNGSGTQLVAYYDQIDQIGTDIQLTNGAWLWKFEGIIRSQNDNQFGAVVGGFEYTLYQIFNSSSDLGILLEYMNDQRNNDPAKSPPTEFDNDVFLAARLAINDTNDSELLAGVIIDRKDSSKILSIEAKRRLNNNWKIEVEGRWFLNVENNASLYQLKNDNYLSLRLARYF